MKFGANDHIVIRQGSKYILGQAVGKTTIMPQGSDETVKFAPEELVAVTSAVTGAKIFGITILPDHGTVKLGRFVAKKHYRMEDDEEQELVNNFKKAYMAFKKEGLATGHSAVTSSVLMPAAKTFCSYRKKWSKDHWEDSFTISADPEYQVEAVSNILALNVWHHMIKTDLQARWISLYDRLRAVHKATEADLNDVLTAYLDMQDPKIAGIKDILQTDNTDLLVKSILSYIRGNHKISPEELDMLAIYQPETVGKMWPKATTYATEKATFPAYAMKDAKSMFAFAIYQHFFGKTPASLEKAVHATIKKIAVKE
jgi:hypothetical protein